MCRLHIFPQNSPDKRGCRTAAVPFSWSRSGEKRLENEMWRPEADAFVVKCRSGGRRIKKSCRDSVKFLSVESKNEANLWKKRFGQIHVKVFVTI